MEKKRALVPKKLFLSVKLKRETAKAIEAGELTIDQVMEKYKITERRRVITWMRQFSSLDGKHPTNHVS